MIKKTLIIAAMLATGFLTNAYSHCQIPCGIYGDDARFTTMLEDVTTIRKAIMKLGEETKAGNHNQIVRWVNNKETHADNISEIAHKYFLAQRIKASQENYDKKLAALHSIIVLSMKAKQTVDNKVADQLEKSINDFHALYHSHDKMKKESMPAKK